MMPDTATATNHTDGSPLLPHLYGQLRATYPTAGLMTELLTLALSGDGSGDRYGVRAIVQTGSLVLATAMATGDTLEAAEDRACGRVLRLLGLEHTLNTRSTPISTPNLDPNLDPNPDPNPILSQTPNLDLGAIVDRQNQSQTITQTTAQVNTPSAPPDPQPPPADLNGSEDRPSPTPQGNGTRPQGSGQRLSLVPPPPTAHLVSLPSLTSPIAPPLNGEIDDFSDRAGSDRAGSDRAGDGEETGIQETGIQETGLGNDRPKSLPESSGPDASSSQPGSRDPGFEPGVADAPLFTVIALGTTETTPETTPNATVINATVATSLVPAVDPIAATIAPTIAPSKPSPIVEDWGEALAQLDVEVKRLGWTPSQESDYLQRHYGHPSRDYLTDYGELLGLIEVLKTLPSPGLTPLPASLPTPEAEPWLPPSSPPTSIAPAIAPAPDLAPDLPSTAVTGYGPGPDPHGLYPSGGEMGTAALPRVPQPEPQPLDPGSAILPPNTLPPNTLPPNTLPPNTLPPNTLPPNTLPPTAVVPSALSRNEMMEKVLVECNRLGWTPQQGKDHLRQAYSKGSRSQLTNDELREFLTYLTALYPP